jgi:hypothetical protein
LASATVRHLATPCYLPPVNNGNAWPWRFVHQKAIDWQRADDVIPAGRAERRARTAKLNFSGCYQKRRELRALSAVFRAIGHRPLVSIDSRYIIGRITRSAVLNISEILNAVDSSLSKWISPKATFLFRLPNFT